MRILNEMDVVVGGALYPVQQALSVCVGYAFAKRPLNWVAEPVVAGTPLAAGPRPLELGRWAYGTYDNVPPDPSPELRGVDLFVADGLNGQMRAGTIATIMAVADEVSAALRQLDDGLRFWQLPPEHVAGLPPRDAPAWHMWRAWSVLMGGDKVGVAVTHKTLHHKRPTVFPLIDNLTLTELAGPDGAWPVIHSELTSRRAEWAILEERFQAFSQRRGAASLGRLRMHDILLWSRCNGSLEVAREEGERIIAEEREWA